MTSTIPLGVGKGAYYNEIDPFAAATMRELILEGVIAPGVVDERDIRDVRPDELAGFTQCHFFAGGGVWSYALRRAGWRDEWPIWTGSCPCQPFSTAGKGLGFADERHLWPAWDWLIDQCGPECVVGEQVADAGADAWLDLVQADLEGMGYAFGCTPLASAGFGAPNPRHRSFWVAYTAGGGRAGLGGDGQTGTAEHRHADGLGNAVRDGARPIGGNRDRSQAAADRNDGGVSGSGPTVGDAGAIIRLADALRTGRPEWRPQPGDGSASGRSSASICGPGPVNGFWRDADWLYCRDLRGPRWRPVNRGTFPLAPGVAGRVGTLRLSGNAINAEVATGFIEAMMDVFAERIAA